MHHLGDDHLAELQVPAEQALGFAVGVLADDRGDILVLQSLSSGQRTPRLVVDACLSAEFHI